ncbi:MAG: alpha/beta hydrolase family protein, partial [Nitrospirales bacterium]
IVQGDKDERVPAQHAYRLKNSLLNGHSRNALRVFKGLNHFFFRNTELSYEIDQGVMSFVADWITNSLLIDVCQKEVRNGR